MSELREALWDLMTAEADRALAAKAKAAGCLRSDDPAGAATAAQEFGNHLYATQMIHRFLRENGPTQ